MASGFTCHAKLCNSIYRLSLVFLTVRYILHICWHFSLKLISIWEKYGEKTKGLLYEIPCVYCIILILSSTAMLILSTALRRHTTTVWPACLTLKNWSQNSILQMESFCRMYTGLTLVGGRMDSQLMMLSCHHGRKVSRPFSNIIVFVVMNSRMCIIHIGHIWWNVNVVRGFTPSGLWRCV